MALDSSTSVHPPQLTRPPSERCILLTNVNLFFAIPTDFAASDFSAAGGLSFGSGQIGAGTRLPAGSTWLRVNLFFIPNPDPDAVLPLGLFSDAETLFSFVRFMAAILSLIDIGRAGSSLIFTKDKDPN